METRRDITIRCAGGVRANLIELEQHGTYVGLLDGGPTHPINEMILENAALFSGRIPTHVVRPQERLVETRFVGPHGPHMHMPALHCRGQFDSGAYRLNIVWFQEDWTPP